MISFLAQPFAVAGLVAACAPLLIHLLNRRRSRTVDWAAMEFLRAAVERSRRIMRLRDLLLLLLRTACVLLFGLAMARPYISRSGAAVDPDQPLHAVLLVDNSLSMALEGIGGTRLDAAVQKARDFVERLPAGSRISIVPQCGSSRPLADSAYRTTREAIDALESIEVVDRRASALQALEMAMAACRTEPDLPSKRVVLLGDQQRCNWPSEGRAPRLDELPDLQVVQVGGGSSENTWVADLKVRDGMAQADAASTLVVEVRHTGPSARRDVQLTLAVNGEVVASKTIDLAPEQTRQVEFSHAFDVPRDPGRVTFVPVTVSLTPDRLPADDQRHLVVPVVAALTVVFVDDLGQNEAPSRGVYGETVHLRRLLAPNATRERGLIDVQHQRIDGLSREVLEDARLVVIAGVQSPEPSVDLLREYVEQGSQLLIAAGADFDPRAWNSAAWRNGAGILPAPLAPQPIGTLPEIGADVVPFRLDAASITSHRLVLEGVPREELDDLLTQAVFFKAVVMETSERVRQELERFERQRLASTEHVDRSSGPWLLWNPPESLAEGTLEQILRRRLPRVLASFTNGVAAVVECDIGDGSVVFLASGVYSSWSTITRVSSVLLLDHLLRGMLERTLPRRNGSTEQVLELPVDPSERLSSFVLRRPDDSEAPLHVDASEVGRYSLRIRDALERGFYRVTAYDAEAAGTANVARLWETPFAVNGPEEESELVFLSPTAGEVQAHWVGADEEIRLEGTGAEGEDTWSWLMASVLALLLLELGVLARSRRRLAPERDP